MICIFTPHHILHNPPKEFNSNHVEAYGESPERVELIYEALMDVPQAKLTRAEQFDTGFFYKIHSRDYLDYLQKAYEEWVGAGLWSEGIMPEFFAIGKMRENPPSKSPIGKAGYYMTDSCTMIVKDTWEAVKYSGFTALTGAKYLLKGEKYVFSLCRPPGHHAGYDYAGGYCFVNNSALAAKFLQDKGELNVDGKDKIAILDLDFHHGNGTQDIVHHLENIFFVSIHGDPNISYPYLVGFESENTPKNVNFPLPPGTTDEDYLVVFKEAISKINDYNPSYLVVSLGVDTFKLDKLSNFKLTSEIYTTLANLLIVDLSIPTLIVMEGGYNIEYLAKNVLSFLDPFMNYK